MQGLGRSESDCCSACCNANAVDHEHASERCNRIVAGLWAQILVHSGGAGAALQSLTLVDN